MSSSEGFPPSSKRCPLDKIHCCDHSGNNQSIDSSYQILSTNLHCAKTTTLHRLVWHRSCAMGIRTRFVWCSRTLYDRHTHWTCRLQQLLDPAQFYVIEEGLNGRKTIQTMQTSVSDFLEQSFSRPFSTSMRRWIWWPSRSSGTTWKKLDHRISEQIRNGIRELIEVARSITYSGGIKGPPLTLVVNTPMPVAAPCPDVLDMLADATTQVQNLARDLQLLVDGYDKNVYFVDAVPHVQGIPIDGLHFAGKTHENFALRINKSFGQSAIYRARSSYAMCLDSFRFDCRLIMADKTEQQQQPAEPDRTLEVNMLFSKESWSTNIPVATGNPWSKVTH